MKAKTREISEARDRMVSLRHLAYFIAVAEELHFGRAAERLDMAQPPLSRQIKQLEDELGAVLFNRGRNAITLTQAGVRLLERARSVLQDIEDIKLEVRRIGQGAEGRLRIGFVGSSTFGVLPNIVKSFRAHYPDINLSLIPMNNARLHRALVAREIDVAFTRPALKDRDFVTRKLLQEPLILAAPDTFVSTVPQKVALNDLRDNPLDMILYPEYPRPSYADTVLDACLAQGLEFKRLAFTMDLQTALSLVAIGEGLCIVPASVGSAPRNGIRFLRFSPPLADTELSLNYRLDEQGVHLQNFFRIALSVARRIFA